jgi:trans-aconitate methyltransferase
MRFAYTPSGAEVFRIFDSGAAAGYLNQEFYRLPMTKSNAGAFREVVHKSFAEQAKADGRVELLFHRIFLLARKP